MRSIQDYRVAETLTEFLQSESAIIFDESNPKKVRQKGRGKELKHDAIQHLSGKKGKQSPQQAERRVEQRLIHLIRKQLIWIKSQA